MTNAPNEASDTTVFTANEPATSNKETPVTDGSTYSMLVGEGKKFKTIEDLAKAKLESDNFIEQLKRENGELRQDYEARLSLQQSVEEIKKLRNQPEQTKADNGSGSAASPQPDDIESIVEKQIEKNEKNKTRTQNMQEADRMIVEKFNGDRAKSAEFLKQKAQELNVGVQWLADMAAQSPKAVMNLLGLDNQQSKHNPGTQLSQTRTVNTDNKDFAPNGGPKVGSRAYYEVMRKEDPKRYFSPKVQQEIFESHKAGTYNT